MRDRPFGQMRAQTVVDVEIQRAAARQFHGTGDPQSGCFRRGTGLRGHRCRPAACRNRAGRRPPAAAASVASILNTEIRSRGASRLSAMSSNCDTVVDGERHDPIRQPARRVVAQCMWLSAASLRSARSLLPCFRKILQLRPGRDFRRAQQARHRERPARIGPGAARLQILVAQPAAQEARHEGVARAQHVVDFDRKARSAHALVERFGNVLGEHHAAHRTALAHDRGGRVQCGWRGSPPACPRSRRRYAAPPRCRRSGRKAAGSAPAAAVTWPERT